MIEIEYYNDDLTFDNTYQLVEFLKVEGFVIPKDFKDTHWMKMFNKLNQGKTIYIRCNPYQYEIRERMELMWSSSKEQLMSRYNKLADDI